MGGAVSSSKKKNINNVAATPSTTPTPPLTTTTTPPPTTKDLNTLKAEKDQRTNTSTENIETTLLPGGAPPKVVMNMINKRGDYVKRLDHEKQTKQVYKWLTQSLVQCANSVEIKKWVKLLLANSEFTIYMTYMTMFNPLQEFCRNKLLSLGAPLQVLCQSKNYCIELGTFMPAVHPEIRSKHETTLRELTNAIDLKQQHLRQDHPFVGLFPSSSASMDVDESDLLDINNESQYLHFLRLVAHTLNDRYQKRIKQLVTPLQGTRVLVPKILFWIP